MIDLRTEPTFDRIQLSQRERNEFSSARHRFIQSISTFVFPAHRRAEASVEFSMSGDGACVESALSLLKSLAHYAHGTTAIVCEAGNEIAQSVCTNGEVSYEVLRTDEKLSMSYIGPRSAHRFLNLYFSLYRAADEFGAPKFGPRFGHGSRFWRVEMPSALGGARNHRRLLKAIGEIGDFMPLFLTSSNGNGVGDPLTRGFDYKAYGRSYSEYIAYATRAWGWSGGGMHNNYSTEYFLLHRWIVSVRSKVMLRDHIVASMNRLFLMIGLSSKISIVAGRSVEECSVKLAQLTSGEITTEALLDWLSGEA